MMNEALENLRLKLKLTNSALYVPQKYPKPCINYIDKQSLSGKWSKQRADGLRPSSRSAPASRAARVLRA